MRKIIDKGLELSLIFLMAFVMAGIKPIYSGFPEFRDG